MHFYINQVVQRQSDELFPPSLKFHPEVMNHFIFHFFDKNKSHAHTQFQREWEDSILHLPRLLRAWHVWSIPLRFTDFTKKARNARPEESMSPKVLRRDLK